MSESRWTPEEFARLVSLPEGHPERRAAEANPAFEAWVRMQAHFESPDSRLIGEEDLSSARRELSARLERSLGLTLAPAAGRAQPRSSSGSGSRAPGVLPALSAWLSRPAVRVAFAFGALAVVASAGWWMWNPSGTPGTVRGIGGPASTLTVAATVQSPGGITLTWSAVRTADVYRVYFYSPELTQLAMLDSLTETRCLLAGDALPAGLARGARVEVEVVAVSNGDVLGRSKLKSIVLP